MMRWERDARFDLLNALFPLVAGENAFEVAEELANVLIETHKPFEPDSSLCELYVARLAMPHKYEEGVGLVRRVGLPAEIQSWLQTSEYLPSLRLHYQGADGAGYSVSVAKFLEERRRR